MKTAAWLLTLGFAAALSAAEYQIDPAHSGAQFSVKHLMVSNVKGGFSKMAGTVNWDPKKPETSSIAATIEVASVNTQNEQRDGHLKGADFFDTAKFPTMTFKSNKFYKQGNTWKVAGDLTLHGVTKPVVLDLVEGPGAEIKDPWGMMRTGATAKTKINRRDFGLSWNKNLDSGGVMVGEEIDITLDIEATRKPS
jgi:polyisoprenoid-binding protein YceI